MFLCYSLCHLLSNDSFCVNHNECGAINEHFKFVNHHDTITTRTITPTGNILRAKNATSINKEELELNAKSINKEKFVHAMNTIKGKFEDDNVSKNNFHC